MEACISLAICFSVWFAAKGAAGVQRLEEELGIVVLHGPCPTELQREEAS